MARNLIGVRPIIGNLAMKLKKETYRVDVSGQLFLLQTEVSPKWH